MASKPVYACCGCCDHLEDEPDPYEHDEPCHNGCNSPA